MTYKDPQNRHSPWLTKQEAVEHLRCSVSTFDRIRKKKGSPIRTFLIRGTTVKRFHIEDLERLMLD